MAKTINENDKSLNNRISKLEKQVFWLTKNINNILGNNGDDHAPVIKVYRGVCCSDINDTKTIEKKHDNDSCYDICAHFPDSYESFKNALTNNPKLEKAFEAYDFDNKLLKIYPNETMVIPTNISLELPNNIECQCRPRSGLSSEGKLVTLGTVDEGYRGEIGIILTNTGKEVITIEQNSRIAQLAFVRKTIVKIEDCTDLENFNSKDTDRGSNGFGSTGTN